MENLKTDMLRSIITKLAWKYIKEPYRWGGDDPLAGFDCSGFIIHLLQSVGILPQSYDAKAKELFEYFSDKEIDEVRKGCIVFFGEPIHHIGICINSEFDIEAKGSGSDIKTRKDAIEGNAFIQLRPIKRDEVIRYVDPFKS